MAAWSPAVAYSDTTPYLAWVTGSSPTIIPYNTQMSIYEQALGGSDTPRPVVTGLYGVKAEFLPDLEVGSEGFHMVFAASSVQGFQQDDLYYAFRPFGSDTWTSEVVITSTQVITYSQGKIWRPRVAVDGNTIRVVWRQEEIPGGPLRPQTIWTVSGVQSGGTVAWGTPQQLSPEYQDLAVRPDIAVDGAGRVHVVWSEMSDTESRPEIQYVNYIRRDGSAWEEAYRLDPTTVKLNTTTPTWLSARVAARGDGVAVVWHGFREYSELEKEEVFIRWSANGGQTWGPFYNASNTPDEVSILPSAVWGHDEQIHFLGVEITGDLGDPDAYDVFYGRGPSTATLIFMPIVLRGD
jgi:hypothetical protein